MKNIESYESFLNEAEEASPMEMEAGAEMEMVDKFDPEAAKKAQADYAKKTGSGTSDKSKTGLNFPNIKAVFGRQDYQFRIAIAQALFLAGKNLFPTNSYHAPNAQEVDLKNEGCTMTYYIGEADQNEALKKVTVKQLEAIKGLAAVVYLDFKKFSGGSFGLYGGKYRYEYTLNQVRNFPEVKTATMLLKSAG